MARSALAASLATVIALFAVGLHTTTPAGSRATMELAEVPGGQRQVVVEVRVAPPSLARDAEWLTVTSWQGGGLVVSELEPIAAGAWRSTNPVPLHGEWKASLRINSGTDLIAAPIYMPADPAIPAVEVPARDGVTRALVPDKQILQREARDDVPGWLWSLASGAVLALGLGFALTLAWGVGRVGREPAQPAAGTRRPRRHTEEGWDATSPPAPWVPSSSSPG